LTCETPECGNANIGIPFEDAPDRCICGVCMNEITNKTEIL
jgi:rubredoxin